MNTKQADPDDRDLLDFDQVAKRLNTSVRSVRTLVSLGHLPVIRSPLRTVRFHPDDVAAYIEKWRSKPVDLKGGRGKPPRICPVSPIASADTTDNWPTVSNCRPLGGVRVAGPRGCYGGFGRHGLKGLRGKVYLVSRSMC